MTGLRYPDDWPWGHRVKKSGRALSVGSVENLDQSQKSESAGSDARRRRNFMTACVLWSCGSRCR